MHFGSGMHGIYEMVWFSEAVPFARVGGLAIKAFHFPSFSSSHFILFSLLLPPPLRSNTHFPPIKYPIKARKKKKVFPPPLLSIPTINASAEKRKKRLLLPPRRKRRRERDGV